MRLIAVAVATIAIIIVGLSFRHAPHATAGSPEAARALMDPGAMHTAVGAKSLPSQHFDAY
jgi:hypothetical protein